MSQIMNIDPENPQLTRKEREWLQHRQEIMAAAAHLFAERGYENTKLEDVASAAEFGKGTLYNYFENKIDLFLSTMNYVMDKMNAYLVERLNGIEDARERLGTIVKTHFEMYEQNRDFLRMAISQQRILSGEFSNDGHPPLMAKYRENFLKLVGEMDNGIKEGEIKPGSGERYARYLLGMIHGQIRAMNHGEMSIDDIDPDEIIDIFFKGVST